MTPDTRRIILFLLSAAAAIAIAYEPLDDLVRNGQPSDYYSHIPLVLIVSAYVLFRRRKQLIRGEPGSLLLGLGIMALGLASLVFDRIQRPGLIGQAELCASGAIFILSGSFIAIFGKHSFRRALFPFAFLIFIIPLPLAWMEHVIAALVTGSMGVTHLLFRAFGVPFVQDGAIFYLPGFGIEVAQECQWHPFQFGTGDHERPRWTNLPKKTMEEGSLVMAVFPVTIFKNGVRIVTLYLLSYFVDMRIIQGGYLHKSGGYIFFGLGLVILGYFLWILRESATS